MTYSSLTVDERYALGIVSAAASRPGSTVPRGVRDWIEREESDDPTPHDPAHRMFDADTGVCCDCPRLVDPHAAAIVEVRGAVAQVFGTAMRGVTERGDLFDVSDDVLEIALDKVVRQVLIHQARPRR